MEKTELTDFNIYCILLDILPTAPIFNFRPYKVLQAFIFYTSVSEDFGRNAQQENILRAKACQTCFTAKDFFPLQKTCWGVFLERCMPLYLGVVFEKKIRYNRCRIFSCLCSRLNASL